MKTAEQSMQKLTESVSELSQMAQQTKGLAASADDPRLILGTRMVETELAPSSCPRTPTYALCSSLSLPPLPSQIHNESRLILKRSSA